MGDIKDFLLVHGRHTSKRYFKIGDDVFIQANNYDKEGSEHANKKYGIDAMKFVRVNLKEHESRIEKLIEKLKGSVDVDELLRQTLYDISLDSIEGIEKELAKKEPRVKAEKGCVALRIGKNQLVLRE